MRSAAVVERHIPLIAGVLVTQYCGEGRWMTLQGGRRVRNASKMMGAMMTASSIDVMD